MSSDDDDIHAILGADSDSDGAPAHRHLDLEQILRENDNSDSEEDIRPQVHRGK